MEGQARVGTCMPLSCADEGRNDQDEKEGIGRSQTGSRLLFLPLSVPSSELLEGWLERRKMGTTAAASCLPPPSSIPFVCPCRVKCLEGGGISSGHSPSQAEESSVAHRRMPAKCRDGVFLQRRPRHDGQRLCQESACIFLGKPSRYAKLLGAASKVAALSTTSTSIESHRVKLKSRRQKHQTNGSVVSRASNRAVREIKRTALTSLTADPPPPPRGSVNGVVGASAPCVHRKRKDQRGPEDVGELSLTLVVA